MYYDSKAAVIVFDWGGKSTAGSTINWREDLHDILDQTDILTTLGKNPNFEIDSTCPNSSMVPEVKQQIKSDSLLNRGTWAFLGSSTDAKKRYLFWTSVDTNVVGADQQIPVIVSRASGGYYISETITAARSVKEGQQSYVAIANHIGDYSKYEAAAAESKAMPAGGAKTGTGKERIEAVKSQSKQIKMTYKEKLEFEQIETMIAGVEAELKMLTLEVNSAGSDFVKLGELTAQQQDAAKRLEQLVERWAYLTELAEASGVF